jgi:hypothetical protein
MKRLETVANVAVVIAAVVLVLFLGHQEWLRYHSPQNASARALVGRTVHLPGVQFPPRSKTLIVAITTNCHFCRDSEPFYKELAGKSASRMVAVLPQPQSEAEQYVHQAIAPGVQVVSTSLDSLGVSATPTLLLLDDSGRVEKAWVGKLDGPGQQQVQSLL